MLRVSKGRVYSVPVLMHALDILDYLSESHIPVTLTQISNANRISMSSTFRIPSTLVHRRYVSQDGGGRFSSGPCSSDLVFSLNKERYRRENPAIRSEGKLMRWGIKRGPRRKYSSEGSPKKMRVFL